MIDWFHLDETMRFIIKVLLNHVIFNKQSKLYSALKMNIISKCSNGFDLEETTRFIKKVLLNCVIFNKQSQLYSALEMNIISKYSTGFHSIDLLIKSHLLLLLLHSFFYNNTARKPFGGL